uniref:BTB domain-containing protein n=1 Tax=Strongyloides papillosus TaxID=174720 RepID=A0A0N5BT88_STREA
MSSNINDSICDFFGGEPLDGSDNSHRRCPYCGRDFADYKMIRKYRHIEACESLLKRQNNTAKSGNMVVGKTKQCMQTTLDSMIQSTCSSGGSKKSLTQDIFLSGKPSTSFLTKSKSVTTRNVKNSKICSCPYEKDHIKDRIAGLFSICEKDGKENVNFSREPFISSKRLLHYEILARDFQRLTKRCQGDVTVKAKNGDLKWHKMILQIRTKFPLNDVIDLSEFTKESLLAYEKYIYGGEIRYSYHLLKDLKTLAERYGPDSLKYYLENDFIIDENAEYIEKYEVRKRNNALDLSDKYSGETNVRFITTNQQVPDDSFDQTMDYGVFKNKESQSQGEPSTSTDGDSKYESFPSDNATEDSNISGEIVNETIQVEDNEDTELPGGKINETIQVENNEDAELPSEEIYGTIQVKNNENTELPSEEIYEAFQNAGEEDINLSHESDILEKNLVINSQSSDKSYKDAYPTGNDASYLDYEDSNAGIIVFDAEDYMTNDEMSKSQTENLSQQHNDAPDYNVSSPLQQSFADDSFCGIIEGGYYSNESRCETPVHNAEKPNVIKNNPPIPEGGKDQSNDSTAQKIPSPIFKTPTVSKATNQNNSDRNGVTKSKREMIEQQLTKSSQLIKYTDITPRPMYEQMSDLELQQELAKYGMGKRSRKKAILDLNKIYNQLHPTVFVDDVIESPKGRKRKSKNDVEISSFDNHDDHSSITVEGNETNCSIDSSSSQEVNILEESCTEFLNSQEVDVPTNTKEKKPKTESEWKDVFVEFIRLPQNKLTYNRMLSYSTFELSEIYQLVKSSTHLIRFISKPMLVTVLDELHISFTIPSEGWENKAKKRKK